MRIAPVRIATNKCWLGYKERRTLIHYWWKCKLVQPLQKTEWEILQNIRNKTTISSSNISLYIQRDQNFYVEEALYLLVIAMLLVTIKIRN